MKKIIFLAALISSITLGAYAQQRGNYGTLQPYTSMSGQIYNNSFTAKAADTLKGVDTVYVYFPFTAPYFHLIDLTTVQKADSLSGTVVVQGRDNNTGWLEIAGQWQSLTTDTAKCATCAGVKKVFTVATGTNHAVFDVGKTTLQYLRVRIVGTRSTDTTAVTAVDHYSY